MQLAFCIARRTKFLELRTSSSILLGCPSLLLCIKECFLCSEIVVLFTFKVILGDNLASPVFPRICRKMCYRPWKSKMMEIEIREVYGRFDIGIIKRLSLKPIKASISKTYIWLRYDGEHRFIEFIFEMPSTMDSWTEKNIVLLVTLQNKRANSVVN